MILYTISTNVYIAILLYQFALCKMENSRGHGDVDEAADCNSQEVYCQVSDGDDMSDNTDSSNNLI